MDSLVSLVCLQHSRFRGRVHATLTDDEKSDLSDLVRLIFLPYKVWPGLG
jgi:hypothetical protein